MGQEMESPMMNQGFIESIASILSFIVPRMHRMPFQIVSACPLDRIGLTLGLRDTMLKSRRSCGMVGMTITERGGEGGKGGPLSTHHGIALRRLLRFRYDGESISEHRGLGCTPRYIAR